MGSKKIKEICTNPLVLTSNIGIIPKALEEYAKYKLKEAIKMTNAQDLFETLKMTIYYSGFSAVVVNGKTYKWNGDEMREGIEDEATQFLYNQDYSQMEIDDIKFDGSAIDYLDEFYPETLKEIELDAAEWYAFDILEKLGFEKKDLQSIEFQL